MRNILHRSPLHRRQKGAVTMFTAVLILILLTEMIIYAVQVGVFEQRKSANEMMQKLSFHTADSGIQQAKQFMSANSMLVTSDWLPDGAEPRWELCVNNPGSGTHPCFGEPYDGRDGRPDLRSDTYFYSFDVGSYPAGACAPDIDNELPGCWSEIGGGANEQVTMHALLCMLDIDRTQDPIVQGCTTDPARQDERYFMITLLSRGEADCDGAECRAETLISEKIGSFGPGGSEGGPGAPLTARTNVPLSGTVEVAANPNGGGVGVPISSWVNTNPNCPDPAPADPISPDSGSYATCERHEWYGQDSLPADYDCPEQGDNCSCDPSKEKMLTYASGNDRQMGQDIVVDPDFPCDLFMETFGMTAAEFKALVSSLPGRVLDSCDSLDETSEGYYWISGPLCDIKQQIGSHENTVVLVSAASETRISAGGKLFGLLMVTDDEDPGAEFTGNGRGTVYGAVVMDAEMKHFNGTFQIVYVEEIVEDIFETPFFGAVAGGWTDFHADWR